MSNVRTSCICSVGCSSESRIRVQVPEQLLLVPLSFVEWITLLYCTLHGFKLQTSLAYSAMVRSLENLPELAMFAIAPRVQPS
jgi:hypothetical protein